MTGLLFLIPIAVTLGLLALIAFFWALRSGQYEDLEGAAAGERAVQVQQFAVQADFALVGQQMGQGLEQAALAGTVGPDQAEQFAAAQA